MLGLRLPVICAHTSEVSTMVQPDSQHVSDIRYHGTLLMSAYVVQWSTTVWDARAGAVTGRHQKGAVVSYVRDVLWVGLVTDHWRVTSPGRGHVQMKLLIRVLLFFYAYEYFQSLYYRTQIMWTHKFQIGNQIHNKIYLQHMVFPGGHPFKYWPCPTLANFSDRTRTGIFNVIWSWTLNST